MGWDGWERYVAAGRERAGSAVGRKRGNGLELRLGSLAAMSSRSRDTTIRNGS
jgi:hypothetical protein